MARPTPPPARRPKRPAARGPQPERLMAFAVAALVLFGLVMVYSASSATALLNDGNPMGLLQRQIIYAGLGVGAYFIFLRTSPAGLRRLGPPLLAIAMVMLVLVLVPGVGTTANGSTRWLALGSLVQVQPSEIAKLALVLWMAQAIAREPARILTRQGLTPFFGVIGALALLVLVEPDLGTAVTIGAIGLSVLLVAGARAGHLAVAAGTATGLALVAIAVAPYRRERFLSFLDPWSDPGGSGFQSVQAQLSVASGGITGVGLGDGVQKAFYLPEAHTDMILATVGEELGLLGVLGVLVGIAAFGLAGYRIAFNSRDLHLQLVAAGLTTYVVAQSVVNAGAVLGVMPITGVPLPFVSFGGSSLVVLLASAGIIVNIGRRAHEVAAPRLRVVRSGASGDRGRGHGRARDAGAGGGRRVVGARR